jgi:hypothetical protein
MLLLIFLHPQRILLCYFLAGLASLARESQYSRLSNNSMHVRELNARKTRE